MKQLYDSDKKTLLQLVENVMDLTAQYVGGNTGTTNAELALFNMRISAKKLSESLTGDSQIALKNIDQFEGSLHAAYLAASSSASGLSVKYRGPAISEQELEGTLERLDKIRDNYEEKGQ
jgi:hypothetical protein